MHCRFTVHLARLAVWLCEYTVALKYYVTVFGAELMAPLAYFANRCTVYLKPGTWYSKRCDQEPDGHMIQRSCVETGDATTPHQSVNEQARHE